MPSGLHAAALVIARPLGAVILGGAILWQVAGHVGRPTARALVHVSAVPADVVVDDVVHHAETLYDTPIVFDLRPGPHTVRMRRDGREVYREEIRILAGEDLILAAWDQSDDGRSPGRAGASGPR